MQGFGVRSDLSGSCSDGQRSSGQTISTAQHSLKTPRLKIDRYDYRLSLRHGSLQPLCPGGGASDGAGSEGLQRQINPPQPSLESRLSDEGKALPCRSHLSIGNHFVSD